MTNAQRLFVKITRESLPQVKDKYPFIYLEHGRLEVDDSSVKWIDSEGNVVAIPVATLNSILLGPGTSLTHAAVKTAVTANCCIFWVGEDSLLFYAAGCSPTSDTRNLRRQVKLSENSKLALDVAREMFSRRFPNASLEGKTLKKMMGMEGHRMRLMYAEKAEYYKVGWKGREYTPGHFELSDITNRVLTAANAALYGIICSVIHSMGYSPHIGFIHSGSPLPFVYDLADLYKEELCVDLAFALTLEMAGRYDRKLVASKFRQRALEYDLLAKLAKDISILMRRDNGSSNWQ